MGILAKTLTTQSAYAARKTDLWPDLMDRLAGCMFEAAVVEFEAHVASLGLQIPDRWHELIEDAVADRRKEIASENIDQIVRDRFDF